MYMALQTRWLDGDLIFYDGTQEIYRLKNGTEGIVDGTGMFYPDPTTTNSTGSTTMTATSNRMQFVASCGQNVTWVLPAETDSAGIEFKFVNFSTGGALTINNDSSGCIAVIDADQIGYILCDGVTWGAMVAGPST